MYYTDRGISSPADFRRVSSIIDVDIVPVTQRRVSVPPTPNTTLLLF